MALEYSTIGTKVLYAPEATAGTRPSTGYVEIENVVSIGEDNGTPEQIEVTNLKDTRHRMIAGLLGDTDLASLTVNFTDAFKTAWQTLITASATAHAAGKQIWFEYRLPGHTDSWYFAGTPQPLGFGGANVAEAQQLDVYITKEDYEGWAASST